MKLFKLIPMVALLLAMIVNVAHADIGKISTSDEVGGKMCERLAVQALKKGSAKADSVLNAPAVKEEAKDSTSAM